MSVRLSIVVGISAIFFAALFLAAPNSASAACAPTPTPIIYLYRNDNCGGTPLALDSDTPDLTQTVPVLNDASALVVGKNISVTLYENINYEGKYICWNGPIEISALNEFPITSGNGWGDDPSSVRIQPSGACASPGITFPTSGQDPLPANAACVRDPTLIGPSVLSYLSPFGGDPRRISQYYKCEGNIPPASTDLQKAVQVERTLECTVNCTEASGSFLEYKDGQGNPSYFCFGAQGGATCEVMDEDGNPTELSIATGLREDKCGLLEFGCWLKRLLGVVASFLDVVVSGLAAIVKAIAGALALAMNKVIEYVVSVPVSPTNKNTAPFVREIWNYSRDLANGFFLLLLAIIGLTTILRIQSYQWQKTLPALVIAVLLINFSGVLVGFVVDMANVLTHAFLKKAVLSNVTWGVQSLPSPGEDGFSRLAFHVGEIVFYFLVSFAYLATMLLFVVRTIALWIIAAIGPLAFALYVLPATKSYWQQWFKALFQWAILGIPASFAIYFASIAIKITGDSIGGTGLPPAFFAQAAGPFAASVILIVGMGMALAGAPAISQSAMKLGTRLGKKAAGFAGSKTWQYARDRVPHETRETMRKASASANPEWGKSMGGLGGRIFRGAAGAYGYSKRTAGKGFTTVVGGSEQADIEKMRAAAAKRDAVGNLSALRLAGSVTEKTAILDAMRQKGQLRDAGSPDLVGVKNVLKYEEVAGIYEKAHQIRNMDLVEGLERAFVDKPDAMRKFAEITDRMTANAVDQKNDKTQNGLDRRDREERKYASLAEKTIGEAKTADEIKALRKDWWDAPELIEAAHKFWAGNQFSQAATTFGRDFINKLEESKKDKGADWYFDLEVRKDKTGREWSTPRNVAAARYFASSAAQGLGLSPLEGLETSRAVTDRINIANIMVRQPRFLENLPGEEESLYVKLRALADAERKLETERKRRPDSASIEDMRRDINVVRTEIKDGLRVKADGLTGEAASQFENDWERIEQFMKERNRKGRRSRRQEREDEEEPEEEEEYRGG